MAARADQQGSAQGVRERSGIRVLDKAFELIEILRGAGELTAAELAARLGEPRASVYRLLTSLQVHGFVDPGSRRGTFRLGLGLARLGAAALAELDIRTVARPAMNRIHDETGETVFLCVVSGDSAVCVERLDGLHVQSLAMQLGGALPLHAGAAGVALLAAESTARRERYLDDVALTPLTPGAGLTPAGLRRLLEQTRRQGYSVSDGDVTVGIAALGAAVFDHAGELAGAVSISGLRELIVGDAVREANVIRIREAAAEISAALGCRGLGEPRRDR